MDNKVCAMAPEITVPRLESQGEIHDDTKTNSAPGQGVMALKSGPELAAPTPLSRRPLAHAHVPPGGAELAARRRSLVHATERPLA